MPDTVETQAASTQAVPDSGASAGTHQAVIPVLRRDLSGQTIDRPTALRDEGCSHTSSRAQAGVPACAPQPLHDPISVLTIVIVLVCSVLIVCGGFTFVGRGPGRLIRPKPRRRGATQRARRWRRRVGAGLVVLGVLVLLRTFI